MIYTPMTNAALKLCFEAHKDQVDKSGIPYVFHPFFVAEYMSEEAEVCVALLHDVMEDTDLTADDIRAAGMSEQVVEALLLMTHDPGEPYDDYIERLSSNPIARRVKMMDLAHNMDLDRLSEVTERDVERWEKYKRALTLLDGLERKSPSASDLLVELAVPNRDDGSRFTDAARLDAIQRLAWGTFYRRVNAQGLFHLYAMRPLEALPESVVLVSSHVDCEEGMDRCFAEGAGDGLVRGTFDNLATNAALLSLMLCSALPSNVVVAFTGDEERGGAGARQVAEFLEGAGKKVACAVVLDVTGMGWQDGLDVTVENDFCDVELVGAVARAVAEVTDKWEVVPSEVTRAYPGLDESRVASVPAMPDESWEYGKAGVPCFSLCVPVEGDMHSGEGVLMREAGFLRFAECLERVARELATRREPA